MKIVSEPADWPLVRRLPKRSVSTSSPTFPASFPRQSANHIRTASLQAIGLSACRCRQSGPVHSQLVRQAPERRPEANHPALELDGSAVVITNDISGAKLPRPNSVWKADGLTDLIAVSRQRFGIPPAEIIASIERDGFYLAPHQAR